jgi:O-antigen/teichoic acid export membrane protein
MASLAGAIRANVVVGLAAPAVSLLASVAIARSLGPAGYAEYATYVAVVGWILLIAEAGGNSAIPVFLPRHREAGRRLLARLLALRFAGGVGASILVMAFGPWWVSRAGLPPEVWSLSMFAVIGIAVVAGLASGLGFFVLLAEFRHATALAGQQASTFARGMAVAGIAFLSPSAVWFALAHAATGAAEAAWHLVNARRTLAGRERDVPAGVVAAIHRHGLVTVFDKVTTQLGAPAFLLFVLAGVHGRADLAILALAGETAQRIVSVAGAPMSSLILPYLGSAATAEYAKASRTVIRLGTLLLLPSIVAGTVVIGILIPLVYGNAFAGASALCVYVLVPAGIEAWGRMTLSAALIASRGYRAVLTISACQGAGALLALFLTFDSSLEIAIVAQGLVRIAAVAGLIASAARAGLWDMASVPWRVFPVVAAAGAAAWIAGPFAFAQTLPVAALFVAGAVFAATFLALGRVLGLFDDPVLVRALRVTLGSRSRYLEPWLLRRS